MNKYAIRREFFPWYFFAPLLPAVPQEPSCQCTHTPDRCE